MHADDIRANNFISNETSYNQMFLYGLDMQ
jgi:hypothetical protein